MNPTSSALSVGDPVEVFWPLDNAFPPGQVGAIHDHGSHVIEYVDGDQKTLNLVNETWRYPINNASTTKVIELQSSASEDIATLYTPFGNKYFMAHHAQGIPTFPLLNSFEAEEYVFKNTFTVVAIADVPLNANIISSHTIYKVKVNDDGTLRLKARIEPHGNEDLFKDLMRNDCSMCAPTGVLLLLSLATLLQWRISKADVKSAFLQTGPAENPVYVRPPYEIQDKRRFYWLLQAAAYGLVNGNAKWHTQSDHLLLSLGLSRVPVIAQLFFKKKNGELCALVAKIVDDVLLAGPNEIVDGHIRSFNDKFKLGTIMHGPGKLQFFGLNITQRPDFTIEIDADEKVQAVEQCPITRLRHLESETLLNQTQKCSTITDSHGPNVLMKIAP